MRTVEHSAQQAFWSEVYCGHPIAIFNRGGRWQVYLDHALQHNIVFETAEEAIDWLMVRVDQSVSACLRDPTNVAR